MRLDKFTSCDEFIQNRCFVTEIRQTITNRLTTM